MGRRVSIYPRGRLLIFHCGQGKPSVNQSNRRISDPLPLNGELVQSAMRRARRGDGRKGGRAGAVLRGPCGDPGPIDIKEEVM